MLYVRDLPNDEKLELYKQIKGWCLFEGCWSIVCMKNIMDEKAKDIRNILFYDVYIDTMEWYKRYSYGRY